MKRTSQRFNKHIHTLIPVLVSTSSEQVDGVLKIEIVMTVKMTSDEIVDLLFCLNVQVLELVHSGEFDNVQTVRQDTIWVISLNSRTKPGVSKLTRFPL